MNTKNIVIGTLVAVSLLLGINYVKAPTVVTKDVIKVVEVPQLGGAPVVNVPAPVVNVNVPKQTAPAPVVLGSVTGPDSFFPYFGRNNVRDYTERKTFAFTAGNGTTTPCAIKSPGATSTVMFASLAITVATSSATTWTIATSSTAFGTTSPMSTISVGASATKEVAWFPNTGDNTAYLGTVIPNQYVVFGVAGGVGAGANGVVVSGSCQAEFREI